MQAWNFWFEKELFPEAQFLFLTLQGYLETHPQPKSG